MDASNLEIVVLAGLDLRLDRRGKSEALYCAAGSAIDSAVVAALKQRLAASGAGSMRICLHADPEAPVHDMIIALKGGEATPVHKHASKAETYQMIEGRMRVDFFDDQGRPAGSTVLGAPAAGLPFMIRISAGRWHTTVAETEYAVFHESRPGPFDGGDSTFPDWAK